MPPLAVDPTALTAAGVSVAAVGGSLSAAVSTLTGAFNANTGQDASGVMVGRQYENTARDLLKAVASGVNACQKTGYGIQVSAVNYSRAEAQSDISGRAQPLPSPPCPAPVPAAGAPSAEGPGVLEPTLWKVVEFLVGDLWPNGDPVAMRSAAAAWRTLGASLYGVTGDMAGPYNAVSAQQLPEGELIKAPIRDIGMAFSSLGGSCQQLATQLEGFAADVEKTQNAIRELLAKLGSVGGIAGMFFEFFKGHGEDELHEIADDIKTVMGHLKNEASEKRAGVQQAEQNVDTWVRNLEKSANREFTEYFGDHVGQVLSSALNSSLDSAEGGFRWLISNAEGIEDMNPLRFAYDFDGALQTWHGVADLSSAVTNPASLAMMAQSNPQQFEALVKGLARTDEWSKDRPMLGASQNILDILTLPFAAGKVGETGEIASAATRVGKSFDAGSGSVGIYRALDEAGEAGRAGGVFGNISKEMPQITNSLEGIAGKTPTVEPPAGGRPISAPPVPDAGPASVVKPSLDSPAADHVPPSYSEGNRPGQAAVHNETSTHQPSPSPSGGRLPPIDPAPIDGTAAGSSPTGLAQPTPMHAPFQPASLPSGGEGGGVAASREAVEGVGNPGDIAHSNGDRHDATATPGGGSHDDPGDHHQDAQGGPSNGGSWEGDGGLWLDEIQNQAADEFLGRARAAEPAITHSMHDIAANLDQGDLIGLDYRLKTEESLKEKLSGLLEEYPDKPLVSHIADIKDSVRYTVQSPADMYASNVRQTMEQLLSEGYECVKLKNTWGVEGYQGINSFWTDPASGHIFELQFHTPESFDAKMSTHVLYEELRLPHTPLDRQQELAVLQEEIFRSVDTPTGATEIQRPQKGGQP